jgi:thiamine-phosphate pyrophosphorylase
MEKQLYAAIDANVNRSLEGLRVCEDVMRFCLKNSLFSSRFKDLRHRIAAEAGRFPRSGLLHGRDVEADSQKFIDLESEKIRGSLEALFSANLHRASEAVRSLEEFGKLVCPDITGNPFQEIRFQLYSIEREAVPVIARQGKRDRFSRSLYAIMDVSFERSGDSTETAEMMIRGGASIIQLRAKNLSKREMLARAKNLAQVCRRENVIFIVNDHADIAVLAGADGVHLGRNDLEVRDARMLVPPHMIIGVSAYSYDSVVQALVQGPDYVAVGPVFDTSYDGGAGAVALKGLGVGILAQVREATGVPLVAIGGITAESAGEALSAGADSVAVLSFLYRDDRIEENCSSVVHAIRGECGRD